MKLLRLRAFLSYHVSRAAVCSLLICLFCGQVLHARTAGNNLSPFQDIKVIWTAKSDQGRQVYLSSYDNTGWSPPLQLSQGTGMAFQPAVGSGEDGSIWAVWSRQGREGSYLECRSRSSSGWAEPRKINTGLFRNKAVTIMVDKSGTPWIAWEGTEKKYADIFWSRWNGQKWETPRKAHGDNDVPDIDPRLSLDESGRIVLTWETFAEGRYVQRSLLGDGKEWQPASSGTEQEIIRKVIYAHEDQLPVPGFIDDLPTANLFVKGKDGAVSIRLTSF